MTILWSFQEERWKKWESFKKIGNLYLVKLQVTAEAQPGTQLLAVNPSCPDAGRRKKNNLNFYFIFLCGTSALDLRCFWRSWPRLCIACKITRGETQRRVSKYFEIFQGILLSFMLVYFRVRFWSINFFDTYFIRL